MKKETQRKPTRSSMSLLHQLCNLIPNHLVPTLARDTGVVERGQSHTLTLLHCLGLRRMARQQRIEHPGALYHVMSGGDRREASFRDDRDTRAR